jgi:polygalacturonase
VLVPAGTFQIGTTELKSNITLHLAASATLLGSGDGKQYHAVDAIPLSGDSTLGDGNWALLFAVNAKNITVEGPGTIDGQGSQFFNYRPVSTPPSGNDGQPRTPPPPPPSGIGGAKRPYHLLFHRCENLVVRDLSLVRCAFHSIRVIQSERVRMDGLYIHNRVNINNDGFHFISAKYVTITNCTVLCQDDACALFGSCQFVTVSNCVFSTRWSVFRFGGGTVRNIAVSNCLIYETYGCPIKLGASGMQLENLSFSNIIMQNVTGPIGINFSTRARNETGGAAMAPGSFVRNISFSNIRATVVKEPTMTYTDMKTIGRVYDGEQNSCITLNGVGEAMIENVSFDDVHVTFAGGGTAELAAKRKIPQTTREYFGVWAEAPVGPPAYGLYARNVKGLTLHNVRFEVANPDLRPAVVFDNVRDVAVNGLSVQGNPAAESVLRFTGVQDALLTGSQVLTPAAAFLQVEGEKNASITVDGGDLSKATVPLAFRDGATDKAVRVRA